MPLHDPQVEFPASLITVLFAVIALSLGKIWGATHYYRNLGRRLEDRAREKQLSQGDE